MADNTQTTKQPFMDILLNDDNDIDVSADGDFKVGPSDEQHMGLIIETYPGNWKEFPTCGVGIKDYVLSAGQTNALKRTINVQLAADGYRNITTVLKGNPDGQYDYDVTAQR